MEETWLVRMAGLIARFFHIDPYVVLDGGYQQFALRMAAYRYVADREEAEAEKAQARQKAGGGR